MIKSKTRNCSIDIFRYVCAIFVVAIHTKPFSDVSEILGYVFTQIVPRIGVPFFFAVSGFFYMQKLEKGDKLFTKYICRLLTTYLVWSCLYYLIDFLQWGHLNLKGFVVNCVYTFIITGSHYHFWFFPALIFAVCFSTLLFKIKCQKLIIPLSILLYIIGCLGCSYYEVGINIPVLGNLFTLSEFDLIRKVFLMGFPFFASGYFVYKLKEKIVSTTSNKKLLLIWIVTTIVWLLEICLVLKLKIESNIVITLGLYLLVVVTLLNLLQNPLPKYKQISNKCRVIANFTYYSHPLCMELFRCLENKNILSAPVTETPMFFITVGLTLAGGLIIYKCNNKNNKLINLLVN